MFRYVSFFSAKANRSASGSLAMTRKLSFFTAVLNAKSKELSPSSGLGNLVSNIHYYHNLTFSEFIITLLLESPGLDPAVLPLQLF